MFVIPSLISNKRCRLKRPMQYFRFGTGKLRRICSLANLTFYSYCKNMLDDSPFLVVNLFIARNVIHYHRQTARHSMTLSSKLLIKLKITSLSVIYCSRLINFFYESTGDNLDYITSQSRLPQLGSLWINTLKIGTLSLGNMWSLGNILCSVETHAFSDDS